MARWEHALAQQTVVVEVEVFVVLVVDSVVVVVDDLDWLLELVVCCMVPVVLGKDFVEVSAQLMSWSEL